ncbi:TetR/AcrR family transcriptional regulator [Pseudonocardia sp. GCM10023141]|uniref:TetR/AcrR family transcriptional regulator n=1 Tax=Pseudonocardia sp. GCM10023141 TaxID=3252653 RepID=UPI0036062DC4
MTAQPMSRKEKAAETELALKAAARALFTERGYLNTKITDITQAADRAAGSFYNHFAGKEEILAALLADQFAAGDAAITPESGHDPDFTRASAIRWHIAGYWRFHREHGAIMAALAEAARVSEKAATTLRETIVEQNEDVIGHLEQVVAAGATLPGPPAAVLSALFGMVPTFADSWRATDGFGGTLDEDAAIDMLTTLIHRALNG